MKEFPTKYLDASDGLAVAVCHSFNLGKPENDKITQVGQVFENKILID